jgi:hypothetical protein
MRADRVCYEYNKVLEEICVLCVVYKDISGICRKQVWISMILHDELSLDVIFT